MGTDEWGFGGGEEPKRAVVKGSVTNTIILAVGFVLFLLYGIYRLINPSTTVTEDGLSIAANVAGAIGVITIVVALVRIRTFNRRKTRGY